MLAPRLAHSRFERVWQHQCLWESKSLVCQSTLEMLQVFFVYLSTASSCYMTNFLLVFSILQLVTEGLDSNSQHDSKLNYSIEGRRFALAWTRPDQSFLLCQM